MAIYDQNQNNQWGAYYYKGANPQGAATTQHKSTLTQEEYQKLMKTESPFSLTLTQMDVLKAICNHRSQDGTKEMLVKISDTEYQCQVCGYIFNPIDSNSVTTEEVKVATDYVIDILQTIKLMFIDLPVESQREYFQIIPLIEKIPRLFELAAKNINKYDNMNNWGYANNGYNSDKLLDMLLGGSSFSGTGYSYGQGPNPAYYSQYVDPDQMPPQGMGAFGTPVGGQPPYAPKTTSYSFTPDPLAGQPDSVTTTTDGATVQADATFKA